jgi:hypothetical protein
VDEGRRFISIVVRVEPPTAQIHTVAGDVDHFVWWTGFDEGGSSVGEDDVLHLELNRSLECRACTMESMRI